MAGGMHGGGGHVWQGDYMVGGMHGRGHVWQGGGMCGRGHAWQGGMHGRGHACHACPTPTLQDMVSQCAGGTYPIGMHSCSLTNGY